MLQYISIMSNILRIIIFMELKDRIARALKDHPENQQTVANSIGISKRTLNNYASGETQITVEALLKLCNYLQVPISTFIGGKSQKFLEERVEDLERKIDSLEKLLNLNI